MTKNATCYKEQENYKAVYTKKNCLSYCHNLSPEQAYELLEGFYGPGFAQWFVDRLPKATTNE